MVDTNVLKCGNCNGDLCFTGENIPNNITCEYCGSLNTIKKPIKINTISLKDYWLGHKTTEFVEL